jgi:hypothetical protein
MFRFSQEYFRHKNGLHLPDMGLVTPQTDTGEFNEFMDLANHMAADFKAGRVTDLLIDDRDIKKPLNYFDFYCGGPASGGHIAFPKQIQAATNTLQEHCTNTVGHFQCTDLDYVADIPVNASRDQMQEKITFLHHGKCPKCGKTRMDQWNEGNTRKDMLIMSIGQRAGKDRTIGNIGAYLHAGYLTLRNLSRAYHLGEGTVFYTTFTATTQTQALKATFTPFLNIIETHPWFNAYHEMLDYSGQKAGKELYKIGKENIVWPHHGLSVTVEAPDDRNLRGNAKIYGSITEFAYFYSASGKSIKLNGDQIFKAMFNSFGTIKIGYRKCIEDGLFDMPPYLMPLASSPRSYKDGIMRYYRQSKTTPTMYGMHYSTFDFNPDAREEDYVTEKATNPEGFRTDFLALPADAVRAFIKSRRLVSTAPDEEQVNAYRSKSIFVKSGAGMRQTGGQIELRKSAKIDRTTPKVMGFDLSAVSNSCAFVIAHVEQEENDKDMETFLTVVDAIVEIIPPQDGTRINPTRLYEDVILPMCEELNVQYAFADHWESARVFTDLDEHLGVQGMQYRCKYQDFLNVRTAIDDRLIVLPKCEVTPENDPVKNLNAIFTMSETGYPLCFEGKPVAHLLYQLLTVEDVMGKTVEKGENSTDDIFRALVLAHKFCHEDPEVRDAVSGAISDVTEDNDFRMVSVGLDGRVMDKREIKPVDHQDPQKAMSNEPFGIIVSRGIMPPGRKW